MLEEFLTTPILLLVVVAVLYLRSRNNRYVELGSKIPGPVSVPILGNLWEIIGRREALIRRLCETADKYDGFFKLWLGHSLIIIVTNPEDFQDVMTRSDLSEKSETYQSLVYTLGNESIFISNGQTWKKARKVFVTSHNSNPAVEPELFNVALNYLKNELSQKASGETFSCIKILKIFSAYVSWGSTFGNVDQVEKNGEDLVDSIDYQERVAMTRFIFPILRHEFLFKLLPIGRKLIKSVNYLRNKIEETLEESIADYHDKKEKNLDLPKTYFYNFMEQYPIEDKQRLIFDFVNLLETSSSTVSVGIAYLLTILGIYPDAQEKILQEYNEVKSQLGREPEVEDFHMYDYLDRFIKETLRITPIWGGANRTTTTEITMRNYVLPKGAIVVPLNIHLTRNPKFFPDPLKFDPDRFLPENVEKMHPFAYVPFYKGPRNCPGKNYAMSLMKLVTPFILKNFKILPHYKSIEEIYQNARIEVTMADINNFPIKIIPR